MACIDIYQALTEDRPYKKGLSHDKACGYLMIWHRKALLILIFQIRSEIVSVNAEVQFIYTCM